MMNILETIGALMIMGAFTLWSGEWWKQSNMLFWGAIALLTPVIIWKVWPKTWFDKLVAALAFCALLIVGSWWFGKKTIKAHIPYLPEITINRD